MGVRSMEDEASSIVDKAQELGHLELAVLSCLISNEHCVIEANSQDLPSTLSQLESICSDTFGLKYATICLGPDSTVDEFGQGLLVQDDEPVVSPAARRRDKDDIFAAGDAEMGRTGQALDDEHGRRIADVVIVRDLNLATHQVQIQTLELMRSGRTYTRKAMYTTPKRFMLIALNNAENEQRMAVHLIDHFHISHFYQPFDEAQGNMYNHPNGSTGSVVRSQTPLPGLGRGASYRSYSKPLISRSDVTTLTHLASQVKLHPDIRAYLHDLTIFMRMHRAVASGITPHATRHMYALVNALAVLHGLDFITPSLVSLAARKVYPHRIVIVRAEDEMSLQWGSEVEAVREYLEGVVPEDVIEDVIAKVEVPL